MGLVLPAQRRSATAAEVQLAQDGCRSVVDAAQAGAASAQVGGHFLRVLTRPMGRAEAIKLRSKRKGPVREDRALLGAALRRCQMRSRVSEKFLVSPSPTSTAISRMR